MEGASIESLMGLLFFLILCSAFFSSSETGMMSLNRYRLRHLVKNRHRGAIKANKLLKRPDRLIGVILIGNNFVNILASAIATIIAVKIWGQGGIFIATAALTLVILIFAEVSPKTVAALHPEKVAFPAAYILQPLLKILYPLVWMVNLITNSLLKLFGIKVTNGENHHLSTEELRTLVNESGAVLQQRNQSMLLGVLELDDVTVTDIMIPRNEVGGIDMDNDLEEIIDQLSKTPHTRMPVYRGELNKVVGILHMRNLAQVFRQKSVTKAAILQVIHEPYFVPESTPLQTQLLNFQQENRRIALVVDEYGDIQGIVTLEDILEEIVGEMSLNGKDDNQDIYPQSDGSYFIDGTANIRDVNKSLNWSLPTDGPKTINGLVMEILEAIPDANICMLIGNYQIETLQVCDNQIKTIRAMKHDSEYEEEEEE
ncbi:HlyC/CorC family transporter [Amphritea sp. 2_MG-2023]|uniref:HlyC/CorC family transporter n=1 Tax=Amphritea TaxID=515417 RepID=UPI001C06DB79|nr:MULTISPECIES: HlyC/CorC family transporter [Amphritea]MBU2963854.1 HlyC/CorC family transporter [Amphritea atlantica]MDO6419019.1 HlyC/CorC family transporter [Amphritea sp. 2_MG-2023]